MLLFVFLNFYTDFFINQNIITYHSLRIKLNFYRQNSVKGPSSFLDEIQILSYRFKFTQSIDLLFFYNISKDEGIFMLNEGAHKKMTLYINILVKYFRMI